MTQTAPRDATVAKIAAIMADASEVATEKIAAEKAEQLARQDALEEIAVGYYALCAIVELVHLGGGRSSNGFRRVLDSIDAENMGFLLELVARKIGGPLEETRFAQPLTCVPPGARA